MTKPGLFVSLSCDIPPLNHINTHQNTHASTLYSFRLQRKPVERNKKTSQDRALEHFDDFYRSVFGAKWPGIRVALLTEHKYVAVVNNFGDAEKTKKAIEFNGAVNLRDVFEVFKSDSLDTHQTIESTSSIEKRLDAHLQDTTNEEIRSIYQKHADEELEKMQLEKVLDPERTIDVEDVVDYKKSLQQSLSEDSEYDFDRMISAEIGVLGLQEFIPATKLKGMEDFVLESDHYRYYDTNVEFPLQFEAEHSFQFPKALDIYIYPKYDISRFSRPKKSSTGVLSHFLLDGASILPPLLLGVNANDIVLDACSAPGGKSLTLLQTLLPEHIVCNDVAASRCKRVHHFFGQYLPDFRTAWNDSKVIVRCADITEVDEYAKYDKVMIVFRILYSFPTLQLLLNFWTISDSKRVGLAHTNLLVSFYDGN